MNIRAEKNGVGKMTSASTLMKEVTRGCKRSGSRVRRRPGVGSLLLTRQYNMSYAFATCVPSPSGRRMRGSKKQSIDILPPVMLTNDRRWNCT